MVGRRYAGYTNQASGTGSTTAALFNVVGATTTRVRIYDIVCGSEAAPGDQAFKFAMQRTTANFGTPTAVTPNPLDPADPAALALFSAPGGTAVTITGTPTVLQWAQNQRATFRWVAAPDSELVIAAVSANGICCMPVISTASVQVDFTVLWAE